MPAISLLMCASQSVGRRSITRFICHWQQQLTTAAAAAEDDDDDDDDGYNRHQKFPAGLLHADVVAYSAELVKLLPSARFCLRLLGYLPVLPLAQIASFFRLITGLRILRRLRRGPCSICCTVVSTRPRPRLFMHHQMFFVTWYIIRCHKVWNVCYSMPGNGKLVTIIK